MTLPRRPDLRLQARLIWDWRPTRLAIVRRSILTVVVASLALALTAFVLPGLRIDGPGPILLGAALLAAANTTVRLLAHWLLVMMPIPLIQATGLVAQFAAIVLVGRIVPGIHVQDAGTAAAATVLLTALNGFLAEVVAVSDDDSYYSVLVRRLVARRRHAAGSAGEGLLIVQFDGVSRPVLEAALRGGHVPHLQGMLRTGTAALHSWRALLPATTPASQAGFLHGRADAVPGFRWYEKATARLLVANHAADASTIEGRLADGRGLLAGGGTSIGNLLAGEATRTYLTMATMGHRQPASHDHQLHGVFVSSVNYVRLVVLTIGEIVKELYQAERQRGRDIRPRMHRDWRYAVERAVTNIALRTLSTALVIEEMYSGAPIIYVDYTGYDAVAHHAGPERQEAIDALEGMDRALGSLLKAAREAVRRYRFVVLSDHGQTLGPSFRQRYGQPLEVVLGSLMPADATIIGAGEMTEYTGTGRAIAAELGRGTGVAPFIARRGPTVLDRVRVGQRRPSTASVTTDAVVCCSGSLAHVYFARFPGRLTREAIERQYPGLIGGLVGHPGIGLLLVQGDDGRTMALGATGERDLASPADDATAPWAPYGPAAREVLATATNLQFVGDLMLFGSIDPTTGLVVDFEELIGSHGGLGGWQTEPFLLCPAEWRPAADPLEGAAAVHDQLAAWRAALDAADPGRRAEDEP
ncbi:MAG TPA: phage holin family protein [Candidatus Sulfotelmatobacter sp.]|nr:phage holin family protein [Candidatus Sulfotelmatobacter sp.]